MWRGAVLRRSSPCLAQGNSHAIWFDSRMHPASPREAVLAGVRSSSLRLRPESECGERPSPSPRISAWILKRSSWREVCGKRGGLESEAFNSSPLCDLGQPITHPSLGSLSVRREEY